MDLCYTEEEIRNFPRCALCGRVVYPNEPYYGNLLIYCQHCWKEIGL